MTKSEFLKQLEKKLTVLPESEQRDALEYYEGYISDAEDEAAAISELGPPDEVAATIIKSGLGGAAPEYAGGEPNTDGAGGTVPADTSPFAGIKTAWAVIIAIFAAPVAFPLVIVLAAVAFVLCALVFSFAVAGGAAILAGAGTPLFHRPHRTASHLGQCTPLIARTRRGL